ncbi:MAG: hypothetical protein AB1757_26980 [Acidobacteriota bacterium]
MLNDERLSIHRQGKTRFIIFNGILKIGLLSTVLFTLIDYGFEYGLTFSDLSVYLSKNAFWIPFRRFFFGYFIGLFMWRKLEAAAAK